MSGDEHSVVGRFTLKRLKDLRKFNFGDAASPRQKENKFFCSAKSEGREAAANRSCKVPKTVEVGLRQPFRVGSPPFGLVRLRS